ncbi:DMT family transporter [Clostridium beijerinckii]|jgi:drug/metabolite transporter (DMT)-like permease|uniref:DMT family transporter n=1 Tax=Clostridium beijerinckii TaxID=1520 RepID=A0AAW3WFK1_CLOBE|nr:DMT family transporter [Clostridium beijerinckii]MBC2459689.1 DMT family transporter [Clostridium beijerinckii]MBC2477173.1 DMT family transporter [Clostridium beijerinckii]MCI1579194.1 DMT family transporter [Clostridium beijerinckii]MCI1585110.1 DMT family transporter [Clostridium beijerinckii]MCI1623143.1 DMT family transporter [Clostridium beijerinckii]
MKLTNLSNRKKGIIFITASAFGFAMMSAFIKISGDLPSFQKTFFRNIVSLMVAFALISKHRGNFFGQKNNQKTLLLRSIFGTLGIVFNFYSIDKLVLSDANMLNKLSPFFVIIFSGIFLKEKVNIKQIIAIIIAFVGTLFIIKPSLNLEIMPAIAGILGGVTAAAAYTCVRALSGKEHPETIVFYFSFISSVITFPLMIIYYENMNIMQLIYLILAGIFASLGQFGITLAYKYAPAKEISIFDYTNIIFSAIISLCLFGILPDYLSLVGYIIIFSASLYMFVYNKD